MRILDRRPRGGGRSEGDPGRGSARRARGLDRDGLPRPHRYRQADAGKRVQPRRDACPVQRLGRQVRRTRRRDSGSEEGVMRRRWWTLVLGLCFAMSIAAPSPSRSAGADSSATMAVTLGPGSRLWLEGTSTLHEYESETHELTLLFVRDPAAAPVSDANGLEASIRSSGFRSVDVRVPVLTLRSKKSGLDKNLW